MTPQPRSRRSALRFALLAFFGCLLFVPPCFGQGKITKWTGTWNNRKYKTDGPLQAVFTPGPNNTLKAKFTGTGIRSKFSFDADIVKKKSGNRLTLLGKTKVNGDQYEWTGQVNGSTLVGNYRSRSGNNGSFTLKLVR